jgi:hypothetical protein
MLQYAEAIALIPSFNGIRDEKTVNFLHALGYHFVPLIESV